ncbi:hypothetical protein ACIA8K_35460 [Catenuloplanes sp. NPDC051500]|uniref:hypothetical protein n=1 Tax=Catenuloplanes sp. NPDC051500 TaxID=3363959 RepID=UPI0037924BAF
MANAGDFGLICADGRFIAVPGGVFYHDGSMADPIDPVALTGALRADRASGSTMVYIQERTRLKPGATERLRRALADLPAPIRDRLVLGTLPGENPDQATWRELAEVFGLAKHAPYQPGMERSARVVPLDESGLETTANPSAVRVLSRAQAAARETLHAALTGAPPSWDRLVELAGHASTIRDDLLVPSMLSGDEQRSPLSATYALAAGIALFGLPGGLDAAALKRAVQPVSADEVLRAWGGSAIPTDPADIVATLLETPGSGALIRTAGTGPVLSWLVSRPEGLAWINPALDGGAAIRVLPAEDAVSLLRALPGTSPAVLRVDPQNRAATVGDAAGTPFTETPTTTPDVSSPGSPVASAPGHDYNLFVGAAEVPPAPPIQVASWLPSSADGVRAAVDGAMPRWEAMRERVRRAIDVVHESSEVSEPRRASAGDVREILDQLGSALERLAGQLPGLSDEAARTRAGLLMQRYELVNQMLVPLLTGLPATAALSPVSELLRDGRVLSPASEMFRAPGGTVADGTVTGLPAATDLTVFMQDSTGPAWAVSTASALPPYTVGVAPDGSYVVAKPPEPGESKPYGFSGFEVFGPDGLPRGTIEATTNATEPGPTTGGFVATDFLTNLSDVADALDLSTFYATGMSAGEFFLSLMVANEKVWDIRENEYQMEQLSSPDANPRDYRQERTVAHEKARERLEERGWTLPAQRFDRSQVLRPAWTGVDPGWAPVLVTAYGIESLSVVMETLDGGSVRLVSGRYLDDGGFAVVNPDTGAVVGHLHSWIGEDRVPRWSGEALSPSAARWFGQEDLTADEFVRAVVRGGTRVREDLAIPGFGLYRLDMDDAVFLVRAMVDANGSPVRARRPLAIDLAMHDDLDANAPDPIAELRGAGWTVWIGHRNRVDARNRTLMIDPYSGFAWGTVTTAQAHQARANDLQVFSMREQVTADWASDESTVGPRSEAGDAEPEPVGATDYSSLIDGVLRRRGEWYDRAITALDEALAAPDTRPEDVTAARTALDAFLSLLSELVGDIDDFDDERSGEAIQRMVQTYSEAERLTSLAVRAAHALPSWEELNWPRSAEGYPEHTVGLAPDGSYVVARAPVRGVNDPHGFTGFDVTSPDGHFRGTIESMTEVTDDAVTIRLADVSQIPGALDLAMFYSAQAADREFFDVTDVHDEAMARTLRDEYGMRSQPDVFGDITVYRLTRDVALANARARLTSAGWTLPDGDFSDEHLLAPAWSDEARGWAPALDGEPLTIVTETLDGAFARRVSGRHTADSGFEVVDPDTGTVVRRLYPWTAPDGGERLSAGLLSAADRRYWDEVRGRAGAPGTSAEDFVRTVVTDGARLRADLLLPGFHLYGLVVGGEFVLVRAMVDAEGRPVTTRPPLEFDRSQFPVHTRDGDLDAANRVLRELYDAGWTVDAGRANEVDRDARTVTVNPFARSAWQHLSTVHERRHESPQVPETRPGSSGDVGAGHAEAMRQLAIELASPTVRAVREQIAAMWPSTRDGIREMVDAARSRWAAARSWAEDASDEIDHPTVSRMRALFAGQGTLESVGERLDHLAGRLDTMSFNAARDELTSLMEEYDGAHAQLTDAVGRVTPLPPLSMMFRPAGAGLPPYTVGVAPDGSYVVARAPRAGTEELPGLSGFDVFGPDGRPRGVIEVETEGDGDYVVTNRLENLSDVPGALDLATFYATGVSDRPYFEFVYVGNEKVQGILETAYGMELLPASVEGSRHYRQSRPVAHAKARERLEQRGWTLPAGDFGVSHTLRPTWSSVDPAWAPAVNGVPLDVVPETMEDGRTRPVSGRREADGTFRVVAPATGNALHLLRSSADPDGGVRWTGELLSPADLRHFATVARDGGWTAANSLRDRVKHKIEKRRGVRDADAKALDFVSSIVTDGTRLRDDLVLPGYGLYRLTWKTHTTLVRAALGPDGQVARVRRPLAVDELQQAHDGHGLLTELREARWSIRTGHRNVVDAGERVLMLNPYHADGWQALTEAHRISRTAYHRAQDLVTAVMSVSLSVETVLNRRRDVSRPEELWRAAQSDLAAFVNRSANASDSEDVQDRLSAELGDIRRLLDQAAQEIVGLDGAMRFLLRPLLLRQVESPSPQVFSVDVAYTDPPALPRMPGVRTAEDQVAELRRHVDAAEARVRAVLDRFPHSDAAEVARTALQELERLERTTPGESEVQNLRFLLDQAAAGVIQLDPSARTVLRPLWSGRETPARPVPAPRSLGSWADGDLASLTAGLSRPVLSVNPAAMAELEPALRAHQRWGEVPIVFTTLGTKATDDVFAELRERFRPIVVQQAVTGDMTKVWQLIDQDGTVVREEPAPTAELLRPVVGLSAVSPGTALPPVLAGLLTADDPAGYQLAHEQELSDPGVRDALDTAIANDPDRAHLAAVRVALDLQPGPTERLAPAVSSVLAVEPAYTGGPVPASFAYDFAAQTGGRNERFALDGLLFQIVLAGRIAPAQALDLLRAAERTAVDRAVTDVFEAVLDAMALSEQQAAGDLLTDPLLTSILDKVRTVASTARKPGTPPPDCVDPIDRTAFVGRLDALRDMLRDSARPARAAVIEAVNYTLANC